MFLYEISTAKVTTEEAADTLSTELRVSNCLARYWETLFSAAIDCALLTSLPASGKALLARSSEFRL